MDSELGATNIEIEAAETTKSRGRPTKVFYITDYPLSFGESVKKIKNSFWKIKKEFKIKSKKEQA